MRVGVCILNRQSGISSRLRWPTSTLTRFVSLPYTKRRTITMSAHPSSRRAPRYLSIKEHYIPNLFPNTPFIDTHCHLRTTLDMAVQKHCVSESEVPSVQSLTSTFFPPEVEAVVDVYCDIPINNEWEVLADKDAWAANAWGGEYYFTIGCHPHSAKFYNDDVEAEMRRALSHPRCVAVGECGLDYKKSQSPHDVQRKVFARQIDLAVSLDKPLVVHTREAEADTIEILRAHLPREHRMHVHCFTDSVGMARTLLSEFPNCVIGITGVITYQTLETTTELLKMGGRGLLGRLVLETDGPFMVPSNCQRKKKPVYAVSHSGMIPYTALRVAELLSSTVQGVSAEEVLDITRTNARRIYGL